MNEFFKIRKRVGSKFDGFSNVLEAACHKYLAKLGDGGKQALLDGISRVCKASEDGVTLPMGTLFSGSEIVIVALALLLSIVDPSKVAHSHYACEKVPCKQAFIKSEDTNCLVAMTIASLLKQLT